MTNAAHRPLPRQRPRIVTLLSLAYALAVLGLLLLRYTGWYWSPLLAMINSFYPFLAAPLALLIPWALLARSRAALGGLAATGLVFGALYAPLYLPRADAPPPDGALHVMTFNTALYLADSEGIVAAIEREGADLVAVQEITPISAARMRAVVGVRYPYRVLEAEARTTGLLSRYPITSYDWFEPTPGARPCLHAVVDWKGAPLHLCVVHPYPPALGGTQYLPTCIELDDAPQQRQILETVRRAEATGQAALVLGDFNISDQTRAYWLATRRLRDSFREAGSGMGWTFAEGLHLGDMPIPGPFTRIDFILHTDDLAAAQAHVGCGTGSDHCYVTALLYRVAGQPTP